MTEPVSEQFADQAIDRNMNDDTIKDTAQTAPVAAATEPNSQTVPAKDHRRRKNPPPPGMSLSAYKRQLRKEKFAQEREEWAAKKKEKRKALKLEKKRQKAEGLLQEAPKKFVPQQKSGVSVIIDCSFDEMMKDVEVKSLGQQLIRCYSENKKAPKTVEFAITSFNKTLLERFQTNLRNQHKKWKGITISSEEFVPPTDPEQVANWVYFSSDSSNTIETLEPNKTYIIGGIVDKGRYKNLCKDKAERLGIQTGRLPIDEFVKISGRRVLTTNHVFEILLKWLEVQDWKEAFEAVLPPRKLLEKKEDLEDEADVGSEEEEEEEEEAEDDQDLTAEQPVLEPTA